jgi:predicted nucleotidyltransferase
MKAIGIIAEYNPFHNGHLYQIKKVKEKYPDYTIVLVMTGNFTERGEVTILDKFTRTEIALNHGIDLVIELPYPFSTQSADYFAYGGITLLEELQVERVIFGSESDDLETITTIAKVQIENNELEKLIKIYSKLGNNYPTALASAIKDLTGKLIDTPNDLLGISYVKTILKNKYKIIPETIKRTNNYHTKELEESISSGTAIRESLKKKESIETQIPKDTISYYKNIHLMDDYFDLLKYKILTTEDLSKYQLVEEGIENTLRKEIINSTNYSDFIKRIKSKRYTYNKISRMLLHILCNFTKEKAKAWKKIEYIRILGFNKKGRTYLNQIKKDLALPLISKITKNKNSMLQFELETTNIYNIKNNSNQKEEDKIIIKGE